jgi:hypothetical protein
MTLERKLVPNNFTFNVWLKCLMKIYTELAYSGRLLTVWSTGGLNEDREGNVCRFKRHYVLDANKNF